MGPASKKPVFLQEKLDGEADQEPLSRRLTAEAILLVRCAILAWTALFVVLFVSLVGVVHFDLRAIAGALVTYAGVLAAVVLAVGTTGLLIWAGELAKRSLKRRAHPPAARVPGGRDGVWDEWLDVRGQDYGATDR